jgi:hypothetical protein
MEDLKTDPEDFGGMQTAKLDYEQIAQRYCYAKGCAFKGVSQFGMLRFAGSVTTYRVICRRHMILMVLLQDMAMGDPSPTAEARALADLFQLNYVDLIDREPSSLDGIGLFNPLFARCARCGGSFVGESIGLFKGERFTHTCTKERGAL